MPALVPHRFLVRIAHPCLYVKGIPADADADSLFELPDAAVLNNFSDLDTPRRFADVRVAWNEFGIAVQVTVSGKKEYPQGDADKPRQSDGVSVWIDTRDARTSHRASRYCHQFHLLPSGGGSDKDEPAVGQTKINRALQDAPLSGPADIPFRHHKQKGGYRVEAFFPAAVLTGFDPEQHPKLGLFYHVKDGELGDQTLSVNTDFPFADDPSLWEVLELVR